MFDPSKLVCGFNDLSICPKMKITDRKIAVDHNCVLQKNGKSRFLITLWDARDLDKAMKDKSNYYIARFKDLPLLMNVMFNPDFSNIIPWFDVNTLILNKKVIMNNLVESKDKFNVIINVGDNIGDLFTLKSRENTELLSLFNPIYCINGNEATISMLHELGAVGIIVDRKIGGIPFSTGAASIYRCFRSMCSIYGSDPIKYTDLFEGIKNAYPRIIADYDVDDPFTIKSIALGAQFFILNSMSVEDAKIKIKEIEDMWMKHLVFINSSDFNDLFYCIECGLASK